jgi:hypothetical protein
MNGQPSSTAPLNDGSVAGLDSTRDCSSSAYRNGPSEGIGRVRLAVAADAVAPTLFVRRGVRPGGVTPDHTPTRFTWALARKD